jgi:hypothetical protein
MLLQQCVILAYLGFAAGAVGAGVGDLIVDDVLGDACQDRALAIRLPSIPPQPTQGREWPGNQRQRVSASYYGRSGRRSPSGFSTAISSVASWAWQKTWNVSKDSCFSAAYGSLARRQTAWRLGRCSVEYSRTTGHCCMLQSVGYAERGAALLHKP